MNQKVLIILLLVTTIVSGVVFFSLQRKTDVPMKENTTVQEKKELLIAAFGDSLTAGYGVDLQDSYPSLLEKKLEEQNISASVINMGVSGETTSGALERVQFILDQRPDIILLELGANDMLRSLPPSQINKNLESIIQSLTQQPQKIILLGMKSSGANGLSYSQEFNAIYPNLAKKYSHPLVPFFLNDVVLIAELNTKDGIHPNRLGYEKIINNNIMPVLLPYIKKNF